MKRISTLSTLLLALPLAMALPACDLEKEDGADTGAVADDEDLDDEEEEEADDAGEDDEGESGSSAGTGEDDSDGEDDSAGTGEGDSDSDGDDDVEPDEGETGGGGEADGIALLHGELPDLDPGGDTGGSGTAGDSAFPDDALLVIIDNDDSATCEDPWAPSECGGNWSISFTLLPEQMVPGSYDLFELNGNTSFLDEPYEEGDCAGGGGSLDGTLVIESIDDATVVGHIEGAEAWDFDANVSFVVPRC